METVEGFVEAAGAASDVRRFQAAARHGSMRTSTPTHKVANWFVGADAHIRPSAARPLTQSGRCRHRPPTNFPPHLYGRPLAARKTSAPAAFAAGALYVSLFGWRACPWSRPARRGYSRCSPSAPPRRDLKYSTTRRPGTGHCPGGSPSRPCSDPPPPMDSASHRRLAAVRSVVVWLNRILRSIGALVVPLRL